LLRIHLRFLYSLAGVYSDLGFRGCHDSERISRTGPSFLQTRLTTTPWLFGDSEVMVKQPPPGHLFGSPVSAFGCPETGFWDVWICALLHMDVKR
jgi:hypothetical protein